MGFLKIIPETIILFLKGSNEGSKHALKENIKNCP